MIADCLRIPSFLAAVLLWLLILTNVWKGSLSLRVFHANFNLGSNVFKNLISHSSITSSYHHPHNKIINSNNQKPKSANLLYMSLNDEPLELCEENLEIVIEEIKMELGTLFGYDPASRKVGITGEIKLVDIDGPSIKISLKGRFWHATDTVMARVESYVKQRIPEIIDVSLDLSQSSIVDDNRLNDQKVL